MWAILCLLPVARQRGAGGKEKTGHPAEVPGPLPLPPHAADETPPSAPDSPPSGAT